MLDKIKSFISKKLFVTIFTAMFLWVNQQLPIPLDPGTVTNIVVVIAAYLFGQAAVDVATVIKNGKSA